SDESAMRTPVWVGFVTSSLDTFDVRAERAQPLVDALVTLVDLVGVADRRRALRAEGRDHHRHAGANVGARHALAVQARGARDDDAVRVTEDDPRAHRDELVDEEEPALEHLLEDEDRTSGLGRDD